MLVTSGLLDRGRSAATVAVPSRLYGHSHYSGVVEAERRVVTCRGHQLNFRLYVEPDALHTCDCRPYLPLSPPSLKMWTFKPDSCCARIALGIF